VPSEFAGQRVLSCAVERGGEVATRTMSAVGDESERSVSPRVKADVRGGPARALPSQKKVNSDPQLAEVVRRSRRAQPAQLRAISTSSLSLIDVSGPQRNGVSPRLAAGIAGGTGALVGLS
jgi:hypothetical protein